METLPILRKVKINHPSADIISIVEGEGAYSGLNASEVAFFLKGEWVVTPIEPFAAYHDGSPSDSDTAVYPWVPNDLIEAFLEENGI
jgi:gentisate 1,2-dioxygenase